MNAYLLERCIVRISRITKGINVVKPTRLMMALSVMVCADKT